eukprot:TRINITY_DN109_c0_g1_i4.p1 TRINITY_DN109_c0_g1~~TRINITY_DN109_c0_g1_i4.p1  ORF type:complete len:377 (+),score=103.55 TRINITY_DN109_c0_g1_i4:1137-2267(+)
MVVYQGGDSGTLKSMLFFWQILGVIENSPVSLTSVLASHVSHSDLGFVGAFHSVVTEVSSVFNFSPASLSCLGSSQSGFTERFAFHFNMTTTMSFPVIVIAVMIVIGLRMAVERYDGRWRMIVKESDVGAKYHGIGMMMFLLHSLYGPLLFHSMSFVSCNDGYLNMYPFLGCEGTAGGQSTVTIISWLIIGLIGIGLPVVDTLILFWMKHGELFDDESYRTAFGFLYRSYRSESFWAEPLFMVRRIIITAIVVGIPFQDTAFFLMALVVTLLLSIWIQNMTHPFKKEIDNRTETISLYCLITTFVAGVVISLTDVSHVMEIQVLGITSAVLICLVGLWFIVQMSLTAVKTLKGRNDDGREMSVFGSRKPYSRLLGQ